MQVMLEALQQTVAVVAVVVGAVVGTVFGTRLQQTEVLGVRVVAGHLEGDLQRPELQGLRALRALQVIPETRALPQQGLVKPYPEELEVMAARAVREAPAVMVGLRGAIRKVPLHPTLVIL